MQNIIATLNSLWEKLSMYMYPLKMSTTDLVEIVIITFLFYYVLVWIKNTRAWMLLRGLLVILLFVGVAVVF